MLKLDEENRVKMTFMVVAAWTTGHASWEIVITAYNILSPGHRVILVDGDGVLYRLNCQTNSVNITHEWFLLC